MPHRDQAEAMRARIEALEQRLKETKREAADERARLEAELAEARNEQAQPDSPAPARGDSSAPGRPPRREGRSSRAVVALLIGGLLLLPVAWFVLVSLTFPSEQIVDLRVVSADDGTGALFVSEVVSHATDESDMDTSRLAVYDLATGERRARRVVQWTRRGGVRVLGPGPEGVWAYEYGSGVVLLDVHDGSVLRTTEELLSSSEREALLWSGELDQRLGYLAGEAAVVVTLRDGSRLVLDGGEARPFAGELPPIPTVPDPSSVTVRELDDGQVLRLEASEGDERHARRLQPSGARLLNGTFVVDSSGGPILLEGPPSVLVLHTESLEDDADTVLSRVRRAGGEPMWTTDLESRVRVRLAHATEGAVVLVTVEGELMAFGLERGEERYRVSL